MPSWPTKLAAAAWDWAGKADDFGGRLLVLAEVALVISGGALLLLRALGLVNTVLAIVGGAAILLGSFFLLAYVANAREASRVAAERSGVEGDLKHRIGCPAARIETETKIDPSGVEVKVAHCLDCGELAYRKGSSPAQPSYEGHERAPVVRHVHSEDRRERARKQMLAMLTPPPLADRLAAELKKGFEHRRAARMAHDREELFHACQAFIDWAIAVDQQVLEGAPEHFSDFQASRAPWAMQGKAECLTNMDARLRLHSELVKTLRGGG